MKTTNIQQNNAALSIKHQITSRAMQLTIEDLNSLPVPFRISCDLLILEKGFRGSKLHEPVTLDVKKVLTCKEKGLMIYIVSAFICERPKLLPFVFDNQCLIKLARHFLRHCSGSPHSLYSYASTVHKYSTWLGCSPDLIIQDVKPEGKVPDPLRIESHVGFLEEYIASLQDEGLTPGRVHCYAKHVRTFYRVNGVKIDLAEPLSRRVTYKDRSPIPEELTRTLDISDLREKVIISILALGAFREETLSKLQYRHVREDIEKNIVPIRVHVEAEITKGKYGDYDTFLGAEAIEYLKLYLELRRNGSPDRRNPPETLTDESPLIRDETSRTPRPIGPKQIRKIVHQLYKKAGLLKPPRGRMYDLRVHSLRKYFKTQMLALGVQPDYVDHMMGHTVDTYHDIQMKGPEFLRKIYAASGLSIRPKTKATKAEALKEIIRAFGYNPEEILREGLTEPHRTIIIGSENREQTELQILARALKDVILQETKVQMRPVGGGPAGN